MKLAFVLYEDMTALDLVGAYEVIGRWPGAEPNFLASRPGSVRCDAGLTIEPSGLLSDLPDPDLVLIPGSGKPLGPLADEALLEWTRKAAESATLMTSVCTGSGVLAAAGLLAGRRATTHWAFMEALRGFGVEAVAERVVFDLPFVTAAGVSAGIDMALALTAHVHGEELAKALQLGIEYDPAPPFDAGSPAKADPELVQAALAALAEQG